MISLNELIKLFRFTGCSPSLPLAEERDAKRSDGRVSKPADITASAWRRIYSPRMRYAVRPSLPQAVQRVEAFLSKKR